MTVAPSAPVRIKVVVGNNQSQRPALLAAMAAVTGLPGGFGMEAYIARLRVMFPPAHIGFLQESYGFWFEVDKVGFDVLQGVAHQGKLGFSKR